MLSDVHGTTQPLEAVLADLGDVDEVWVLGDLVALGPDPVGAYERLRALPNARFTRGNTDRFVFEDLPRGETFVWTREQLGPERVAWLESLPLEVRMTLADGTELIGVHASPGRDDGDGVRADNQLDEVDADLVFTGHTHVRTDRTVGRTRYVNLGSVALPPEGETRASYVLVDDGRVERRLVDYDHDAVLAALRTSGNPAADELAQQY
jgi:predicted phosphodiesterase